MHEVSGVPPSLPPFVETMSPHEIMQRRRDYWAIRRDLANVALSLAQHEVGLADVQLAGPDSSQEIVFFDPFPYENEREMDCGC